MSYVPPPVPERWDVGKWDEAHWDGQIGVAPDAMSYVLTGYDVGLLTIRSYVISASPAAFTLTGYQSSLRTTDAMLASTGTFTLTPQQTTLTVSRMMPAAVGAFTLTPVATTNFRVALSLTALTDSFVLTGYRVGLMTPHDRNVVAAPAAFTLAGYSAGFVAALTLPASTSTVTLTGSGAGLIYAVGPLSITMAVSPGFIAVTGMAVDLTGWRAPPFPVEVQPGQMTFGRRVIHIPGRW